MLGLHFCARAFSNCWEQGPLFIAVRGPLTAEHKLQRLRLSSCGSRAQLLRGMWDPPRPGLEPVSPALARRLSTTAPPGKPRVLFKKKKKTSTVVSSHISKYMSKKMGVCSLALFLLRNAVKQEFVSKWPTEQCKHFCLFQIKYICIIYHLYYVLIPHYLLYQVVQ